MPNNIGIQIDVNSERATQKMQAFMKALAANGRELAAFNKLLAEQDPKLTKVYEAYKHFEKQNKGLRLEFEKYSRELGKLEKNYSSIIKQTYSTKRAQKELNIVRAETQALLDSYMITEKEAIAIAREKAKQIRQLTDAEANQIKSLKDLTANAEKGSASLEKMRLKYDQQYSTQQKLITIKKELMELVRAEQMTMQKAIKVYSDWHEKLTGTQAAIQKHRAILEKKRESLIKIKSTYVESFAVQQKVIKVEQDLTKLLKAKWITEKQYSQLLAEQKDKIYGVTAAREKALEAQRKEKELLKSLMQIYDKSFAQQQKLLKVRQDLNKLVAAGNITRERAIQIYTREHGVITGITKQKEALARAQKKNTKQLSDLLAKYDATYAKQQQLIKAERELKRLVDAKVITQQRAIELQQRYAKSLEKTAEATKRQIGFFHTLNEVSRAVSHAWRIILGMYMAERMFTIALSFERTAEKLTLLSKKLEFFTNDAQSLQKVSDMAFHLGYSIDDLGKIMTRFAITTKGAFSTDEMLNWSESLIKSARATGTTTQELNSTLIQLSQAFSAGRLMGDEYRSISENLPMLKIALEEVFQGTEHAGVGLKTLSSQGLITQDVLIEAFAILKDTVDVIPGTLDTIDASIGRLKVGWESLVKRFYADSTIFKDLFNTIAGTLVYLSEDQNKIQKFEQDFQKLASSAKIVASAFQLLIGFFDGIAVAFTGIQQSLPVLIPLTLAYAAANGTLAASFKAATAAALTFGAGLSKISKGLLLIASFSAGWSLGSWLRDEFIEVELFGIAMVNGILKALNYLKYQWEEIISKMKYAWAKLTEDIVTLFLAPVTGIVKLLDMLPDDVKPAWLINFNSELKTFHGNVDVSGIALSEFTQRSKENKDALEKANAEVDKGTDALADFALASKEAQKNQVTFNTANIEVAKYNQQLTDMLNELDPVLKANTEFEASMDKLWESFENSSASMEDFLKIEALLIKQKNSAISKTSKQNKLEKEAEKIREKLASQGDVHRKNIQKAGKLLEKNLITYKEYIAYQKLELALSKDIKDNQKIVAEGREAFIDFSKEVLEADGTVRDLSESSKWLDQRMLELAIAVSSTAINVEEYNRQLAIAKGLAEEMRIKELALEFNEVYAATHDYNITLRNLKEAYSKGAITIRQFNEHLYDSRKAIAEAESAAGNLAATLVLELDKIITGFGDDFKTMFRDALDGNEDVFDNFAESMENRFKDMLAEMAYQAFINPIILNVQQGLMGSFMGSGSGFGASPANTSGGNFSLSSLSNFFSPTSGSMAGSMVSGTNYVSNALGFGNIASPATQYGAIHGIGGTPITNTGITFGGSNLAIGAAGFLGGLGANYLFDGKGYSSIGGGIGSSLGYSLGVGSAASGGIASSLGMSAAIAGPVGAVIGMLLGGALGSLFGSDKDTTPDLGLRLRGSGYGNDKYNTGLRNFSTGPAGDPDGLESSGVYFGRFSHFGFGTKHDPFQSEEESRKFAEDLVAPYMMYEEMIAQALGEETSDLVAKNIKDVDLKLYAEEGNEWEDQVNKLFRATFSNIFTTIGEVASKDYETWYRDFVQNFGKVETGVAAFATTKALSEEIDTRSTDQIRSVIKNFVGQFDTVEDQLVELSAVASMLSLENTNTDFRKFISTLGILSKVSDHSAQELLKLGTDLITVNKIFKNTGNIAYELSLNGAEAAESLLEVAGGMEAFVAKTSFYYDNFFTADEKAENTIRDISDILDNFNRLWDTDFNVESLMPSDLRKTITNLGYVTKEQQAYYNALLDLAPAVIDLNAANKELGNLYESLEEIEDETKDTTDDLTEAVDEFNNAIKELYYELSGETEIENAKRQIHEINTKYGLTGDTAIRSKEQLKTLIGSLDGMDEATRDALPDIKQLGKALINLDKIAEDLNKSIDDKLRTLYGIDATNETKLKALEDQRDLLEQQAEAASDLYDIEMERYEDAIKANEQIKEFLNNLSIGDLAPLSNFDKMQNASNLFSQAVSSGDADAATEYAKEYLEQAQDYYASTTQYADIYDAVTASLNSMIKSPGAKPVDNGQAQLDALDAQIDQLNRQITLQQDTLQRQDDIKEILTDMLDLAITTDTGILAIAEGKNIDWSKVVTDIGGREELITFFKDMAKDNEWSTWKLADVMGMTNADVVKALGEIGLNTKVLNDWNTKVFKENTEANRLMIGGLQHVDQSLISLAGANKWSSYQLADMLGVSQQSLVNKLTSMNYTTDQIAAWDSKVHGVAVNSNSVLKEIDANTEFYSKADQGYELGYGGQYTDNQLLHYIGENTFLTQSHLTGVNTLLHRQYGQFVDIAKYTYRTAQNLNSIAGGMGVPSYRTGTDYVPNDGLAMIHKGEMVIDPETSQQLRRYGVPTTSVQNNEQVCEELRALREEVQQLRATNAYGFKETIRHTERQADAQEEIVENERLK